jgi:hypothetical protein
VRVGTLISILRRFPEEADIVVGRETEREWKTYRIVDLFRRSPDLILMVIVREKE